MAHLWLSQSRPAVDQASQRTLQLSRDGFSVLCFFLAVTSWDAEFEWRVGKRRNKDKNTGIFHWTVNSYSIFTFGQITARSEPSTCFINPSVFMCLNSLNKCSVPLYYC